MSKEQDRRNRSRVSTQRRSWSRKAILLTVIATLTAWAALIVVTTSP